MKGSILHRETPEAKLKLPVAHLQLEWYRARPVMQEDATMIGKIASYAFSNVHPSVNEVVVEVATLRKSPFRVDCSHS